MSKESNQEGPVRVRKLISPPLVSFSGEPATPVMSGSEAQKLATKEERMREHYRRAAATSLWVLNLDEEEMASLLNSPVPEKPTPSEQQKEPVNRRQSRRITIVERIARSIRLWRSGGTSDS